MTAPPQLLTPREVGELLQVGTETLKRWRYAGDGPAAVRVGGQYRYRPNDVAAWLDAQPVTAG
jgi:excisionase family DNA binding protein